MAKKVIYSGFRGDWPALSADFKLSPAAPARAAAAAAKATQKVEAVKAANCVQSKLFE